MKYFTVELLNRFRSEDEDVSVAAHEEWDAVLQRYRRREDRIKNSLPASARRFIDRPVCLHDARLLKMGKQDHTFVMILEMEPPCRDLAILTFTLDAEAQMTDSPLKGKSTSDVTWLYEEWNIDRRQRPCFEVLLSNGLILTLHFRDFHYVIMQQVMPGSNGQIVHPSSAAMTRSA